MHAVVYCGSSCKRDSRQPREKIRPKTFHLLLVKVRRGENCFAAMVLPRKWHASLPALYRQVSTLRAEEEPIALARIKKQKQRNKKNKTKKRRGRGVALMVSHLNTLGRLTLCVQEPPPPLPKISQAEPERYSSWALHNPTNTKAPAKLIRPLI